MILCMNNKIIEIEIKKMMFSMQGVPTNKINMNQLPKWISIFWLLCLWLDDSI